MRSSRYGILTSVILIVFGVVLMIWPENTLLIACRIAGWGLVVFGAVGLVLLVIRCLSTENAPSRGYAAFSVLRSLIALASGILFLVYAEPVVSILPFLFGALILLIGLTNTIYALLSRKDAAHWLFPLVSGILTCVFGAVVMLNPFSAAAALLFCMGLAMVSAGICSLFAAATLG